MKKAALYLRVSTEKQTAANQLEAVEALARARGFEPVRYFETSSAVAKKRPEFERMMRDARSGKVQAVAVWALDRLHRSMAGLVRDVTELHRLGVRVLSVQEPWIDQEGPVRELLTAIFGWVGQMERRTLIERTHAGLERARAEGKQFGRPRASPALVALGIEKIRAGGKVAEVSAIVGVSERTLRRELKKTTSANGHCAKCGAYSNRSAVRDDRLCVACCGLAPNA